jgi:hypothetical protein
MEVSIQTQIQATLLPGYVPTAHTEHEAGLTLEAVWTLWRRKKFLVHMLGTES